MCVFVCYWLNQGGPGSYEKSAVRVRMWEEGNKRVSESDAK